MTHLQDAFGQEIYAYFQEKGGFEVIERDDGYVDLSSGPVAYFQAYKDWPAHQKKVMKYVQGKVLDIGCGAGRHALYLQSQGFDVIGIDKSPLAIKVCKLRGLKTARLLPIEKIDASLGKFDTLLMQGNNFGLFGSFQKARRLLKRFCTITSERARIIAESLDPYDTDNPFHLSYHRRNRQRSRMSGQIRMRVRYKKYVSPWFDYLCVSQEEMNKILKGTGWRVRKFIVGQSASYNAIIEKE